MGRSRFRDGWINATMLVGALLIAALLCEVALRLAVPTRPIQYHYVWPPGFQVTFAPRADVMPGVTGESRFIVNARGFRGDDLADGQDYRIMAIGGSTTECTYLDQEETWPHRLQVKLSERWPGRSVWVGNAGRSGRTTRDHVTQLRHLLPELPRIDAVVFLIGVNDLSLRLKQDESYDAEYMERPGASERLLDRAFALRPGRSDVGDPWFKRTRLYRLAQKVRDRIVRSSDSQDREGTMYAEWREHRRRATAIRDSMPDLGPALDEYARNVNTLIDLATQHSVRPLFLTQPALWRAGLAPELARLLWVGRVGEDLRPEGQEYYSVEALAEGMRRYNERLMEVCRARNVECIDLAALLPKDTTVFYDDDHYNESGADRVAGEVAAYMLQYVPFAPSSSGAAAGATAARVSPIRSLHR